MYNLRETCSHVRLLKWSNNGEPLWRKSSCSCTSLSAGISYKCKMFSWNCYWKLGHNLQKSFFMRMCWKCCADFMYSTCHTKRTSIGVFNCVSKTQINGDR